MTEIIAGIEIPDTPIAKAATDLVREAADDLLYDHSRRVYLWGSLKARYRGLEVDPEAAYVGAMFHDLGLTEKYRTRNRRFEVDGAELALAFLLEHGYSEYDARQVWYAIALHTTPELPMYLAPEIAVVTLGVETDVLGFDLDQVTEDEVKAVTAAHPRPDFKKGIIKAFYEGMKDRPDSTFGTMNDDVIAHFEANFRRADFVSVIQDNAWPE
ncbi:HD domain-containing protein [Kibdelosporangium philippinense]|uniref:HD domain-containing protein n=1 Tax=Kibdelosporangium philippinense TaxID=211113 RepID=A0ABS8ZTR9_9PSEU|nr:HD domain-containing protein [Kibdelosporangium philippinense]MCE7011134.1 HD domain-containing protein [Kibdelosporangium philippinense]